MKQSMHTYFYIFLSDYKNVQTTKDDEELDQATECGSETNRQESDGTVAEDKVILPTSSPGNPGDR